MCYKALKQYGVKEEAVMDGGAEDDLLTPSEVARLFRVNAKTVSRWEATGKLRCIRTLGGHRRFRRGDVERAIADATRDQNDE